ncbi:hypothetical protein OEP69_004056, partial [Acinetobacter baumannii]
SFLKAAISKTLKTQGFESLKYIKIKINLAQMYYFLHSDRYFPIMKLTISVSPRASPVFSVL